VLKAGIFGATAWWSNGASNLWELKQEAFISTNSTKMVEEALILKKSD
jgi:hypothetical protein